MGFGALCVVLRFAVCGLGSSVPISGLVGRDGSADVALCVYKVWSFVRVFSSGIVDFRTL